MHTGAVMSVRWLREHPSLPCYLLVCCFVDGLLLLGVFFAFVVIVTVDDRFATRMMESLWPRRVAMAL